ncbi:hypothetical protein [Chroococcus sp. FPU101]|uniref:hypothetical protein n=1 Tax=Chroococcus sp. FPU101 TaxID=1974212 RepID=UPI001A8D67F0|nr:hypothetical protein [Chroococcus sp. FPU101]GFE68758.1 hypothetical protein CFPU101_13680 [Chroococcus sp. FPU101]
MADDFITCSQGACEARCRNEPGVACVCAGEPDGSCTCYCGYGFAELELVSTNEGASAQNINTKTVDSEISICIHDAPLIAVAHLLNKQYSGSIKVPAERVFSRTTLSLKNVSVGHVLDALGLSSD